MPSDADQVECFVFDACALIAYLNDELGADPGSFADLTLLPRSATIRARLPYDA